VKYLKAPQIPETTKIPFQDEAGNFFNPKIPSQIDLP
jgi:hypothetical protein